MGDHTASSAQIAAISAKIMVVTIIVVFLLMLFLFCVHIYARCYWSTSTYEDPAIVSWRRREARRTRPSTAAAQRRGLNPSALRSIPVTVYNPKNFKDGLECAVCLSELSEGEKARILPKCNHGFHVECIDMWFHSHSNCPLCRNPVVPAQNPSIKDSNRVSQLQQIGTSGSSSSDSDDNDDSYASARMEPPTFPRDNASSSGSASSTGVTRPRDELVIEIPRELFADCLSSPLPISGPLDSSEEPVKSPVVTRLRSLKRLLSRGKRVAPSPRESSSEDVVDQV